MMDVSRIASKNSGQLVIGCLMTFILVQRSGNVSSEISNGIAARCVCVYFKRCSLVYKYKENFVILQAIGII